MGIIKPQFPHWQKIAFCLFFFFHKQEHPCQEGAADVGSVVPSTHGR